jgi:murein tripeptide amidase MpaA
MGVSDVRKSIFGGYMNTDEVDYALVHMSNLHPDIVTLIELPHKTCEGRVCKAIRLSTSKDDLNSRIGVLFTGGMHAREWGGSDICIGFLTGIIDSLISNTPLVYGNKTFTSDQIKSMLNLVDLYVFPNVNPDGKIYSQAHDDPTTNQQGVWWRKNRNPGFVPSGDDPNHSTGVDINRNFNFLRKSGIGTINEIDGKNMSETYKGRAAFSEPETRNVNYLFDTFGNIQYYVDIHSFGGMILYSWGDDRNQSKDPRQNFINPEYDGVRGNPTDLKYKEFIQKTDEINYYHLRT